MDTEINIKEIEKSLNNAGRITKEETLIKLQELYNKVDKELKIEDEEDRIINEEKNQRIEKRRLREEERKRIHGYKHVRFKKQLPPLEERRQYTRCCRKCEGYYRTFAKYGMICDGCKTSGVADGVPSELNNNIGKRK